MLAMPARDQCHSLIRSVGGCKCVLHAAIAVAAFGEVRQEEMRERDAPGGSVRRRRQSLLAAVLDLPVLRTLR